MNKRTQEKFIKNYETRIKKYRDEYYHNISKQGLSSADYIEKEPFINFLPVIISLLPFIFNGLELISFIISILSVIIINLLIGLYKKIKGINDNNYIKELRRIGFFSIEDYERKIKEYITGPNGFYNQELQKIKNNYQLTDENCYSIIDVHGNKHLISIDNKHDKILLINASLNSLPEVKDINFSFIWYYRYDKHGNRVILKTDIEELYFTKESLSIFDKLIKEKKFESKTNFDPAEYINDFELFMSQIRRESNIDEENLKNSKLNALNNIYLLLILLIIILFFFFIFKEYKIIIFIFYLISLNSLNKNCQDYFSFKNKIPKSEEEYIKNLNQNHECIENFNELKLALNIPNNAYKIFSPEGACYLTWSSNGYFHIFLNLIYFNVVYMVVKIQDVKYYEVKNSECIVKLKDKTLYFSKDAEEIFKKILPNKDYTWIKGLTK